VASAPWSARSTLKHSALSTQYSVLSTQRSALSALCADTARHLAKPGVEGCRAHRQRVSRERSSHCLLESGATQTPTALNHVTVITFSAAPYIHIHKHIPRYQRGTSILFLFVCVSSGPTLTALPKPMQTCYLTYRGVPANPYHQEIRDLSTS
jgi:hypothetical protein